MSLGALVAAIAILFVIGNVMGLKPKAGEVRIGEMRLLARKLELNPKLVAIPDWLMDVRQNKGLGKNGMIAQYTLINDEWRLPAGQVAWVEGAWQGDFVTVMPPSFCTPYLKGLSVKANSVTLYWHDEPYAKSFAIKDEGAMAKMKQDLMTLKEFLVRVASR